MPLGTVVKRKRGGALLGELTAAGQTLVVARGGKGGLGVVKPKESQQNRGKFIEQVRLLSFTALPRCSGAAKGASLRHACHLSSTCVMQRFSEYATSA